MRHNLWNDEKASQFTAAASDTPADQALALRVYSSRLIGSDPDLVMHGGGNTSVKVTRRNIHGDEIRALATAEPFSTYRVPVPNRNNGAFRKTSCPFGQRRPLPLAPTA